MKSIKKKVVVAIILSMVFGLSIQSFAVWSGWHTFRIPHGSGMNHGPIVNHDNNLRTLNRTTGTFTNTAITRQARVESRGQTMASNPQVRVHRPSNGIWNSPWGAISNNSHRLYNMPMTSNLSYRVQIRAATNQVSVGHATYRMNVQLFVR